MFGLFVVGKNFFPQTRGLIELCNLGRSFIYSSSNHVINYSICSGSHQLLLNSGIMNSTILSSIKGSLNVITGCGSGLGKSTVQWFLKNGCGPTLCIDRHIPGDYIESLEISREDEDKLMLKNHDTFDEGETERSLKEFTSKYKKIDNLINVAGVALAFAMFWQNSGHIYQTQHMRNLIKFNTYGTFNMIRQVAKHMIDDSLDHSDNPSSKCIINTSTVSTTSPCLGQTMYSGSNAAIDSMTLCLAREFSPFNIRCNTINVGYFDTQLVRSADPLVTKFISDFSLAPKRLGTGEEFGHLVQTMIENQMLNGACVKIDAGMRIVI